MTISQLIREEDERKARLGFEELSAALALETATGVDTAGTDPEGSKGPTHAQVLLSKDSLESETRKVQLPGAIPQTGHSAVDTMASANDNSWSITDMIYSGASSISQTASSWWYGQPAATEAVAKTEKTPSELYVDSFDSYVTDAAAKVGEWASSIWNFITGQTTADGKINLSTELNLPANSLSPKDRYELKKFITNVNQLIARLRETLDEATFEQLMEATLQEAHGYKKEDLDVLKQVLKKKHETLSDEQIKRLNEAKFYIEKLKRNKYFTIAEEVAGNLGIVSAGMKMGSDYVVPALLYAMGKLYNSYKNDAIEHGVAGGIAWTSKLLGYEAEAVKQGAYQTLKLGLGVGAFLFSFSLGIGPSSLPMLLNGGTMIARGLIQRDADRQQGRVKSQGEKVKEAQDGVSSGMKDWSKLGKRVQSLWKSGATFASSDHSAKKSMLH